MSLSVMMSCSLSSIKLHRMSVCLHGVSAGLKFASSLLIKKSSFFSSSSYFLIYCLCLTLLPHTLSSSPFFFSFFYLKNWATDTIKRPCPSFCTLTPPHPSLSSHNPLFTCCIPGFSPPSNFFCNPVLWIPEVIKWARLRQAGSLLIDVKRKKHALKGGQTEEFIFVIHVLFHSYV